MVAGSCRIPSTSNSAHGSDQGRRRRWRDRHAAPWTPAMGAGRSAGRDPTGRAVVGPATPQHPSSQYRADATQRCSTSVRPHADAAWSRFCCGGRRALEWGGLGWTDVVRRCGRDRLQFGSVEPSSRSAGDTRVRPAAGLPACRWAFRHGECCGPAAGAVRSSGEPVGGRRVGSPGDSRPHLAAFFTQNLRSVASVGSAGDSRPHLAVFFTQNLWSAGGWCRAAPRQRIPPRTAGPRRSRPGPPAQELFDPRSANPDRAASAADRPSH